MIIHHNYLLKLGQELRYSLIFIYQAIETQGIKLPKNIKVGMDQKAEPEAMDQTTTTTSDGAMQPSASQPYQTAMDKVFGDNGVINTLNISVIASLLLTILNIL